jgi:hypothetical protein
MSPGAHPDLEPLLRRAFIAPAVAEWTRGFGRPLIVSTTEDDDTAAANCAVEVVLAVDGAVRGKVTYTLPAQTALAISEAGEQADAVPGDPLPAVTAFFKPIASQARDMLQSGSLDCVVAVGTVKDVRGSSYLPPVAGSNSVHMVTQPSVNTPAAPQPVSLWFDLTVVSAPSPVAQAARAVRGEAPAATPSGRERPPAESTAHPSPAAATATASAAPAGGKSGPDGKDAGRGHGFTPVVRTGRLEIVDESGTARAVVSTLADGSPHIVFADRDGRIRAAISLARDGQPRILFLDEMGRRILDLPPASPATPVAAPPAHKPAPPAQPRPAPRAGATRPATSATRPATGATPPAGAPRRAGGPQAPRRA